ALSGEDGRADRQADGAGDDRSAEADGGEGGQGRQGGQRRGRLAELVFECGHRKSPGAGGARALRLVLIPGAACRGGPGWRIVTRSPDCLVESTRKFSSCDQSTTDRTRFGRIGVGL